MAAAFFMSRKESDMDLTRFFTDIMSHLPEKLQFELSSVQELIPSGSELITDPKHLAVFAAALIVLGLLGTAFFGRRSSLNHALSSSVGILAIYALTAFLYSLFPHQASDYLSPLPFVAFSGEYMRLFPIAQMHYSVICYEALGLLILAFLMNLFDTVLPRPKNVFKWFLFRFLSVILTIISHVVVSWLLRSYLPDALALYAPIILLCALAVFLLLGVINVVIGLVAAAANPILGAVCSFFFSTLVGKQISKAVLTTAVLTALFVILDHFGIGLLLISQAAMIAYLPVMVLLLVVWYLVGHIL